MNRLFVLIASILGCVFFISCSGGGGTSTSNNVPTAPSGLTYSTNPAVYTVGVAITPNTPNSSGGNVSSYSVSPALPAGLSLNTSTGVILGTPTAAASSAIYTVTASNSAGSATAALSITLNSAVTAPSGLTYSTNPAVYTAGAAITPNTPNSSGGDVSSYSVSPALPAGLSLNTSTGVISGTPTAAASSADYSVTASNSAGSANVALTITVNTYVTAPSGLTYSTNPVAYTAGAAITPNTPNSSGGDVSSYNVLPALPAGLSLNTSTGVISGTPTAAASSAVYTVTASNSAGSATVALTITVNTYVTAPNWLTYSTNPAVYTVGVAITPNTPNSSGGNVSSYSVSPALPAGLSLNTSMGVISGTPLAAASSADYSVTASNSAGSATAALSITVNPGTSRISITTTSLAVATQNVAYQQGITATGGTQPYTWSASGLPSGMLMNSSSGALYSTPTVSGTFSITVTVTDNSSPQKTASQGYSLTVNPATSPLSITTTSLAVATQNVAYQQGIAATGGTQPYTWSASGLPSGMLMNSSSGALYSTPTVSGTFSITVTVKDNSSPQKTASQGYSLTVNPATQTGCGDERDQMIAEYATYGGYLSPTCASFTKTAHSVYFAFAELNVNDSYSWAIIRYPLTAPASSGYGLDLWRADAGGVPRYVNSAYRAPAHNQAVGGVPNSRHIFGDAVDLRNVPQTQAEYNLLSNAANEAQADYIEPWTGPCGSGCVHGDWRNH